MRSRLFFATLGFRGWGSKGESTVVDKEVSELSVSQKKYAANSQIAEMYLLSYSLSSRKSSYSHTVSYSLSRDKKTWLLYCI